MVSSTFEDNIVDEIFSGFNEVSLTHPKRSLQFKVIYTFVSCMIHDEIELKILDYPKLFISLLCLSLSGSTTIQDKNITFKRVVNKESSSLLKTMFYLVNSYMIALCFLEYQNINKAIKIIKGNSHEIYRQIKKYFDGEIVPTTTIKLSKNYVKQLNKKIPYFIDIINSNYLLLN